MENRVNLTQEINGLRYKEIVDLDDGIRKSGAARGRKKDEDTMYLKNG